MSFLACGLESVNSQGPFPMLCVSLEPPPVKMSSAVVLTASVTKLAAMAPLVLVPLTTSLKIWSQSCEVVVEPDVPRTPEVALPSSSNTPAATGSPLLVPPPVGPKMSRGIKALTVTDTLAPAARVKLLAVRKSLVLIEVVSNWLETFVQVSWSAAGSWSLTRTLVAGPAPSLVTVMVNEAVSPGWITSGKPEVAGFEIGRCGTSGTLDEAWAVIWLLKLPRFWASVKTTVDVLVSGVGSPAWIARVSVKVNDPPGATLPPP